MVTTVIMTIVTPRYPAVHKVLVTVDAIKLTVSLVKLEPGYAVAKVLLAPATVAVGTLIAQFTNFPAGRVASTAGQTLMESVQFPVTVTAMCKSRFFANTVALVAGVRCVTIITNSVYFFVCLMGSRVFLQVVTVAAVFLLVTVNTAQSEQIDVFLMMKCHQWAGGVRCGPDPHLGDRYNRVGNTQNVRRVDTRGRKVDAVGGQVTDDTFGVMTPFPVTPHTLTVKGTF